MKLPILLFVTFGILFSCSQPKENKTIETKEPDPLKKSLLFYASFDNGIGADYAKGDPLLYDSPSRRGLDTTSNELKYAPITHLADSGVSGSALRFDDKSPAVAYFKGKDNVNYSAGNWQGTISFWLKLNPDEDLKPGYCDPIQITDVRWNDGAIWVDFTKELPRQFRLGVMGDIAQWNPENTGPEENPEFEKRMVRVETPPFNREKWTHIIITHQQLGSDNGVATLYVDGKEQGQIDQSDPFTWELDKANIYLGLSYIGLMDELLIFDRPLSNSEIAQLSDLSTLKEKLNL